jgi:steroid delta-isomerase-like uncharacterized protein
MSTEENKELARRYVQEWNLGDREGVFAFFAQDFVDHTAQPGQAPGLEGLKQGMGRFFDAFPDCQSTLKLLVAEGDMVTKYGTLVGTHKGNFFGIPPTGKKVSINHLEIHRFRDGKIVEGWHLEDNLGVMQQIGAIPAPH